ncbi:hypothetical protein C0995_001657 [Termitomyces sp. Mi166|nr:hypothetical protein C0995_001657 [Termitomyces sp. Mi166\
MPIPSDIVQEERSALDHTNQQPRESTIYDDEDLPPTGGALEPQPEPQVEPRAVQESIEAEEHVRAARAERRRIDQDDATNNLNLATSNQGTEGLDQNPIAPNLANITLIEDLEHLLAAVEELNNNPAAPEISDEP